MILLFLALVGGFDENRLLRAIDRAEGSQKYHYGIKHKYQHTTPRQACLNTLHHAYRDWLRNGKRCGYLDYLADRYCPKVDDRVGNRNWKTNVKRFYRD